MKKIVAIVPAYNEEEVIGGVIDDLKKHNIIPVIIVDGSSDDTERIAKAKKVTVLNHIINRGQGAALMTGFEYAKKMSADCIVTFDSDGQHHASEVEKVCEPILNNGVDVVLGSRFLQKNSIPFFKKIILQLATFYTRMMTGLQVTDTHNGLRAFTPRALSQLTLTHDGMAHASEILELIAEKELSFREVPVTVSYSDYSKSKGQRLSNSFHILFDLWFK